MTKKPASRRAIGGPTRVEPTRGSRPPGSRPAPGSQAASRPTSQLPPFTKATVPRRAGALLYEALLLAALALLVGFAMLPLVSPGGGNLQTLAIPPLFARAITFCALAAAAAVYYTWCWSDGRRTLPQKTWRLRIAGRDGRAITRRVALLRYAAWWIGPAMAAALYIAFRATSFGRYVSILLALNYVWVLVDPDGQFLHDRIAGTRVFRTI